MAVLTAFEAALPPLAFRIAPLIMRGTNWAANRAPQLASLISWVVTFGKCLKQREKIFQKSTLPLQLPGGAASNQGRGRIQQEPVLRLRAAREHPRQTPSADQFSTPAPGPD